LNRMTFGAVDRLMGTGRRNVVLISPEDAERLKIEDGANIIVHSATGEMKGVIRLAPVQSGTVQAYWPEANVLIARRADPVSSFPDYDVEVRIEKL
jgi:anaerobic selenocysteine-containing dehydrogenase